MSRYIVKIIHLDIAKRSIFLNGGSIFFERAELLYTVLDPI
jgi:hypothetical protein